MHLHVKQAVHKPRLSCNRTLFLSKMTSYLASSLVIQGTGLQLENYVVKVKSTAC